MVGKPVNKQTALVNRIIARGNKTFGEGTFVNLDAASSEIRAWYSTGCAPLDVILSGTVGRGMPSGRIIELFGDEHVGKTTLGCMLMRDAQQMGGVAVHWDTEGTFTATRAVELGLDPNRVIYGEECFLDSILHQIPEIIEGVGDLPCIMFVDTIAGSEVLAERGKSPSETGGLGAHARVMSAGFRRFGKVLTKSKTLLLMANQLKTGGIGNPFATDREKDATLGGKAMRFHAHMRLKLEAQRKFIVMAGKTRLKIGEEICATVVKDKERASDVKGRSCLLVLRQIGPGAGKFDSALSTLRTLQNWHVLVANKEHPGQTRFGGKWMSTDTYVARYNDDDKFRGVMHKLLERSHQCLMQTAEAVKVDDVPADEEDFE